MNYNKKEKEHGLRVNADERKYIYLCGIEIARTIELSEGVVLLPASCSPEPDDMIDAVMKYGSKSEFELGILISTMRKVTAQLRICSDDAKCLIIRVWNSQTICVLLGALLNCEIAWYFQGNDAAENFHAKTRVSMIYPNMYKFPTMYRYIDLDTCRWIEKALPIAEKLSENERFLNAANALWSYRWNPRPAIRLSVIWGGIESLFLIEKQIKYRLSVSISRFLVGNDDRVEEIKILYNSRSKAIHELQNGTEEVLEKSVELLHSLILRCIEVNNLPEWKTLLYEIE